MDERDKVGGAVALALMLIVPLWRICRRTGHHPALSLLIFLPGIGALVLSLILAFGRWPALQRTAAPEK